MIRPLNNQKDLRQVMLDAVCDVCDLVETHDDVTACLFRITRSDGDGCEHDYVVHACLPEREIRIRESKNRNSNEHDRQQPTTDARGPEDDRPRDFDPDRDAIGY